ncbi:hypothetical protein Acsp05_23960 [Actinokineospora sp. NBRC 105648]|nr:hypothetical protein Acsp05_23960 [Actinokineospora sp. NBRC 105648]
MGTNPNRPDNLATNTAQHSLGSQPASTSQDNPGTPGENTSPDTPGSRRATGAPAHDSNRVHDTAASSRPAGSTQARRPAHTR